VSSPLAFAEELERRDADVARALAALESLRSEIEEVRAHAGDAAEFLASAPQLLRQRQADVESTNLERLEAEEALRVSEKQVDEAQGEKALLEATRARQQAEATLADATRRFSEASIALSRAVVEKEKRTVYAETLAARAAGLAPRVRDGAAPREGLTGTIEWASQARGALLLEHSNLEREREAIVRQASELAASVLGVQTASVAGLRDRLAGALGQSSA
jgi:chromosome segregation ATPase